MVDSSLGHTRGNPDTARCWNLELQGGTHGREVEKYLYWERPPHAYGESDHLVVLGGRESRSQGEGGDSETQPSKETCAGHAGPDTQANLTEGNSHLLRGRSAEASLIEEPGAGKPHAGICAGGVG